MADIDEVIHDAEQSALRKAAAESAQLRADLDEARQMAAESDRHGQDMDKLCDAANELARIAVEAHARARADLDAARERLRTLVPALAMRCNSHSSWCRNLNFSDLPLPHDWEKQAADIYHGRIIAAQPAAGTTAREHDGSPICGSTMTENGASSKTRSILPCTISIAASARSMAFSSN